MWISFVLFILSWILYYDTINNGFTWDDRAAVVTNCDVTNPNNLSFYKQTTNIFSHDFWGQNITLFDSHKSYRPLTVISYRLNFIIHGINAAGYHVVNVFLYSLICIVIFDLLKLFVDNYTAIFGSLLFLFHPIHIEAVASVVGRADLLCCFFYVNGIYYYIQSIQANTTQHRNKFLFGSYSFAIMSCLSKEIGLTLFGVFIFIDILCYYGKSYFSIARFIFRICSSFFIVFLFLCFRIHLNGQNQLYPWTILENHIYKIESLKTKILSFSQTNVWYFVKLIFPRYSSFDYGYSCIPIIEEFSDMRNLLPISIVSFLFLITICFIVKLECFGLISLAILVSPLIPALNILIPIGTTFAERLLLIPSIGFSMLCCYVMDSIVSCYKFKKKQNLKVIIILLFSPIYLAMAAKIVHQNKTWHNEKALFNSGLISCPLSIKALSNNVALNLYKNSSDSKVAVNRALTLYRNQTAAYFNLGFLSYLNKNYIFAIYCFEMKILSSNVDGKSLFYYFKATIELAEHFKIEKPLIYSTMHSKVRRMIDKAIDSGIRSPLLFELGGTLARNSFNYEKANNLFSLALHETRIVDALASSGLS